MYHGRIIELASRERLFAHPQHPCTHALLASIPSPDPTIARNRVREHAIVRDEVAVEGEVEGCRFHPRCPLGTRGLCRTVEPGLDPIEPAHRAACHYPQSAESLAREAALEPAAPAVPVA
jgi:oligopeptide/dipeptide ABC transporter ATP-binding protein